MTFVVNFRVDGEPVGKGRPRFARQGGFVKAYTPAKTAKWEDVVRSHARDAMGMSEPLEGPLALSVRVWKCIPASWSKKKQQDAVTSEIRPTGKPDIDNYVKAVMDAGNGILWVDDSQVVELHSMKAYSKYPCVEIFVAEILP